VIRYECDRCGVALQPNDHQRYILRMEVFAAADHIDLDAESASRPHLDLRTVISELAKANPDDVEDRTYRILRFDLCDNCRRAVLRHPLGQ